MLAFSSPAELEDWINRQPKLVALLISNRQILRTIPLLKSADQESEQLGKCLLHVFRICLNIHHSVRTGQFDSIGLAAAMGDAFALGAPLTDAAAYNAKAAVIEDDYSSWAIYQAFKISEPGSANQATSFREANIDDGELWHLQKDVHTLWAAPLWSAEIPLEVRTKWEVLCNWMEREEAGWDIWIDWYNNLLNGGGGDRRLENSVTFVDQSDWNIGPHHANSVLKAMVRDRIQQVTSLSTFAESALSNKEQLSRSVSEFDLDDLSRLMRMTPFDGDIKLNHFDKGSKRIVELTSVLRDSTQDLLDDLQNTNASPQILRYLNRYNRELSESIENIRPGRIVHLSRSMNELLNDENVRDSLPNITSKIIDDLLQDNLLLLKEYFTGALYRLSNIETSPELSAISIEEATHAIEEFTEKVASNHWDELPGIEPRIHEMLIDHTEQIKHLAQQYEFSPDPQRKERLKRYLWGDIQIGLATIVRLLLRSVQALHKSVPSDTFSTSEETRNAIDAKIREEILENDTLKAFMESSNGNR